LRRQLPLVPVDAVKSLQFDRQKCCLEFVQPGIRADHFVTVFPEDP
jgi:hypothetical protein